MCICQVFFVPIFDQFSNSFNEKSESVRAANALSMSMSMIMSMSMSMSMAQKLLLSNSEVTPE